MGFNCGIVGLPNVGKSTLFNALTASAAAAAENYPFCTIEPNLGRVVVPDARLEALARLAKSERIVPTQLEFVDIAGLVRGASKGEGLGNQFLAHIRETEALAHVLRCFAGAETVETELMLADLESLERRFDLAEKKAKGGEKEASRLVELMAPALAHLRDGRPARHALPPDPEKRRAYLRLGLITAKPMLYVLNVDEAAAVGGNAYARAAAAHAAALGCDSIVISAAIEAEIAQLTDAHERKAFLANLGLAEPGLERFIRAGYRLLGLITFFTAGPKEARAWTVARGATAAAAAGVIHTDFERGFIRAETIGYDDYVKCGGEQGAKDAGKMRQEGRDYVVQDGDVMLFKFNV